jgi:hypothetical protein
MKELPKNLINNYYKLFSCANENEISDAMTETYNSLEQYLIEQDIEKSDLVSFIEKNYSSILGLDGLQIIVNADNTSEDKSRNQFEKIGYEVMNSINGTEIMKRYKLSEGKEIKNRMHEYRVEFLKSRGY